MYWIKMPFWFQRLMPKLLWRQPRGTKTLYLTFDDGPIPEVTPWVLAQLAAYDAKATFFCVGDNVRKHPSVFEAVRTEGHSVGNHTFHHLNGWKTADAAYFADIEACAQYVDSPLFRPPYGRLTRRQRRYLLPRYQIVMWTVLTGDFDPHINPQTCWQRLKGRLNDGDIIVFHDSLKANDRLRYTLPRLLAYYSAEGYHFAALPLSKV